MPNNNEYDLVFEGGGAKGVVFVGAIKVFEKKGLTARRFVGTSAGAITATLLAAGYNAQEVLDTANEKLPNGKPRFSSFMDIPESFEDNVIKESLTYAIFRKIKIPFIWNWLRKKIRRTIFKLLMKIAAYREIFSFIERGGLYSGNKFLEWMQEKLEAKGEGLGKATLLEFAERTGSDLSMVASDTSIQEMLVLNSRTAPDCPVAWAVRMSMSIPFVWQEVKWKAEWGKYMDNDITGNIIVDGGVLSNFPIHLLTSTDKEVTDIMGDTDPAAVPNLGFLIDEKLTVKGSGEAEEPEGTDSTEGGMLDNIKRLKTVRRIGRLIDTMTGAHDLASIEAHKNEICRLPAKGYGTTEFGMKGDRMQALINAGEKAMREYFA